MCSDGDEDGDGDDNAVLVCRCCGRKNAWRYVLNPLPIKDRREELADETLIIWTEGLGVDEIVALAV